MIKNIIIGRNSSNSKFQTIEESNFNKEMFKNDSKRYSNSILYRSKIYNESEIIDRMGKEIFLTYNKENNTYTAVKIIDENCKTLPNFTNVDNISSLDITI